MDIDELTVKVAENLSRRRCVIHWRDPVTPHALGETTKDALNTVHIEISDCLSLSAKFSVFLHELAHARNDFDILPRYRGHAAGPVVPVVKSEKDRLAWRFCDREMRAKSLGATWEKYSESHAYKFYQSGRTETECKLLALLNYNG